MDYIIFDSISKTYSAYGEISWDSWSVVRSNATKFPTKSIAKKVRSYLAKVRKIRRRYLKIEVY